MFCCSSQDSDSVPRLQTKNKCSICLTDDKCVKHANCDHWLCTDCFKSAEYVIDTENAPEFPYPPYVEMSYYCSGDNAPDELFNEYPLIMDFEAELSSWKCEQNRICEMEGRSKRCWICSK